MKPFVSTSTYGLFNWVIAITLIASPWIFGYSGVRGAAVFLPVIFGWLQLIMAIFSKHKFGFMNVFPVPMHCFIDVVGGSFLMASPWVYAYSQFVFWPQLLIGGLVFFLGVFTRTSPFTDEPKHTFKDGLLNDTADIE